MNRSIITIAALALSSAAAMAQNAPAATPKATPASATTSAPVAAPAPITSSVGITKGSAATPAEARTAYQALIASRETTCKARGNTFRWSPAHSVGDANPKGGFYAKNSGGTCREMTLKQARELGLVTVR
jgi:hypothetical protein